MSVEDDRMFVGPFFYIKEKINGISGLYAALMPVEKGLNDGYFINNELSHANLFDRLTKDIEYFNVPRGRVLFDIKENVYNIYIDPTIEEHLPEIVELFRLENYKVGYDEHYTILGDEERE